MKQLLSLLIVLLVACTHCEAQDSFESVVDEVYEGGTVNFYNTLYPNLKYPRKAREKCVMGAIYTHLYISEIGSIDSITFSNKLGHGIEESITDAQWHTEGNWSTIKPTELTLFFGFQVGDDKGVKGDIKVQAYKTVNGKRVDNCKSNKELLEEFTKLIKKEKFKKAKKKIDELVKRDPNSEHYLGLKKFVEDKLEK